jgi:hypothetical protein
MEQGSTANPNLGSLEKTTGKIVFFPDANPTQGENFGVIQMVKVGYGLETEKIQFPIDGAVLGATSDNIAMSPEITFEGHQITDDVEARLNLGTQNADVVQASGTGSTVTVTAKLGKTFDLGFRNISNLVATVGGVTKALNTDYFADPSEGLVRFPFVAAGIADGGSVLLTFDKAALTRKSYTGGTKLSETGKLVYFERDGKSTTVRAEWTLPGTLSPQNPGDGDPKKTKQWSMKFAVSGQWTKTKRAA